MHVDLKFTGDGILAFIGGALALIGVWLSNKQSVLNLQKQLDAEKQSRKEEQERRNKSMATAVLFEMDSNFRAFVHNNKHLFQKEIDIEFRQQLRGTKIDEFPFPVYRGCTPRLGDLPADLVQAVVHFYGLMSGYLRLFNELYSALRRAKGVGEGEPPDREVELLAQQIKTIWIPLIEGYSKEAFGKLCAFTTVPKNQISVFQNSQESNAQTN